MKNTVFKQIGATGWLRFRLHHAQCKIWWKCHWKARSGKVYFLARYKISTTLENDIGLYFNFSKWLNPSKLRCKKLTICAQQKEIVETLQCIFKLKLKVAARITTNQVPHHVPMRRLVLFYFQLATSGHFVKSYPLSRKPLKASSIARQLSKFIIE